MAIIYCYGDNKIADGIAKETAETLATAYPNHSWWIEAKGGILIIKHFGISGRLGMVRHLSSLDHSAKSRRRDIVLAAGELLERAGLPRRDYRGETVLNLEVDGHLRRFFSRPLKIDVIH